MSEQIEVIVSELATQDGRQIVLQAKSDPLRRWRKWYSAEWAPGSELSSLGLTDDDPPVARGKTLSIHRKLKAEAMVDGAELERFGFRPY
jgi:hypothetical protein